jgi:hypothetical protein
MDSVLQKTMLPAPIIAILGIGVSPHPQRNEHCCDFILMLRLVLAEHNPGFRDPILKISMTLTDATSTMAQDSFAQGTHRPVCSKCKHYYVTWEEGAPHGCKAMGFKSRDYPYVVAFHVSGILCQMFKPKEGSERSIALHR